MLQLREILRKWWVMLILGVICLITGIWFLSTAGAGYVFARTALEINFLIIGIVLTASVIMNREMIPAWGWDLAAAILVVITGICLIVLPGVSDALILSLYAVGFIGEGIICIRGYFSVRRLSPVRVKGSIAILILGIISLVLGVILVFHPEISLFAIDFMASFAIFSAGVSMILGAISMSKYNATLNAVESTVADAVKQGEAAFKEVEAEAAEAAKKQE